MAEPILRQWELLRAVPRHPRKATAQQLADRLAEAGFETSLRTVQRDLVELAAIFPLAADERERPYGWSWTREAVFELPAMDSATALAFQLTARFLDSLWPQAAFRDLAPYLNRAEQVLARVDRDGVRGWPDKVRLLPRGLKLHPPEIGQEVLETVYRALVEERRFDARYWPRNRGEARDYRINPLGLVVRDGVLYLVATFWNYTNPVQLAVHRLEEAWLLDEPVHWPAGFDLDGYIAAGGFRYPESGADLYLHARFSPDAAFHLYEVALSEDQELTETAAGVELTATVQDTQELRWWLLGFGASVRVLGPETLVRELADVAERMVAAYRDGG